MNFYNPYYNFPYSSMASRGTGLFSRLLGGVKGINWGNMFTNVQRTLNLVNQAIPVIKQVNPMIKNAKTMFRVMSEFNKNDLSTTTTKETSENKKNDLSTTTTKEISESKKKVSVTSDTKTSSKTPETNNIESSNFSQGPTFFL